MHRAVRWKPQHRTHTPYQQFRLTHAPKEIHLWHFCFKLTGVTLAQAASHHEQLTASGLLILRHLKRGIDRFFLCRSYKATSVHKKHLRLFRIRRNRNPRIRKAAEDALGIHAVF